MLDANLTIAFQLQKAGRFADAARAYHGLLERQPDNADALHLFGVLHHQSGYFARAVELIGKAVALRPGAAAFHANLAEAYRALGQYQQAIDCCQTALRLRPDYPEAANNLGLAFHDTDRFAEAVAQFNAALTLRPDFAVAQNNLGTSLRELGRIGQAMAAYRAAVELDPELALARSNLGQLLVDQGEAEEGLTHCLEAVRLQPDLPAALNNLGNAYRALERWSEAHAAYDRALGMSNREPVKKGELAQVNANRGMALFLEGRRGDAFAFFNQAVDLVPEDAAMWRYLANAHDANEDHAAALSVWQKIVEMTPEHAAAHNALGWSLQQENRFAEAGACYRRALELNPRLIDSILNQGSLHEELGEMGAAEASYRRAHALLPDAPNPLARLAQLLRGKLPEGDRDAIEAQLGGRQSASPLTPSPGVAGEGKDAALAATPLPPNSPARGPLLFGLAQVLDARGDYQRAAECLAEANALSREQRRSEGKKYDPASHAALVDRMIAGFTPGFFQRLSEAGDNSRLPVFVFGMPRSGTSLVEQILASHSGVHGAGELRLACQEFESIPELLGLPDEMLPCLEALDAAAVRQLSQRHLESLGAILKGAASLPGPEASPRHPSPDRIVDKMPDNYLYIGMLSLLFPRATFISVRRDLRDVAVSCWMTHFRTIRWADDPANLAARCRDYRRLMEHWQAVLPVTVHEVVYERLVDDFDTEAPRLLAACGLDWEAACGKFHQTSRPVRTASVTQVRQPLYRKAVQRWKHYEAALADLFAQLPNEAS